MHITHTTQVECHRTHKSYRSHASHNDHLVASADFPDILEFLLVRKFLHPTWWKTLTSRFFFFFFWCSTQNQKYGTMSSHKLTIVNIRNKVSFLDIYRDKIRFCTLLKDL